MSPRKRNLCHIWSHVWLTFINIVIAREHMAYLPGYSRVGPTGPWSNCLLLLHRCGGGLWGGGGGWCLSKPPAQIHDLNPEELSEEETLVSVLVFPLMSELRIQSTNRWVFSQHISLAFTHKTVLKGSATINSYPKGGELGEKITHWC